MSNNEPETQSIGQPPAALINAIRKVLRPIVRLLISYQITYPTLLGLLKSLYVEVAEQEFQVQDKRQSDSRITLLTGVHRKDIKRIREEQNPENVTPKSISVGAQLIATWMGGDDFVDANGVPLPLPLRSDDKGLSSFDDLVARVCKQDIRPRVILDEWLNLGVAHVDENKCVVLNTGAFTPAQGLEEKLFFYGKNIHDHLSASTSNLLGNKPSYFDRSVYYDQLSAQSIETLRNDADEIGMHALSAINKKALALQIGDSQSSSPKHRMNFGVFNYSTEYASTSNKKDGPNDA
jgi:hypothetical protein